MSKFYRFLLLIILISNIGISQSDFQKITLEDIFVKKTFTVKGYEQAKHLNDGENYSKFDKDGNIISVNYVTGEKNLDILSDEYLKNNIEGSADDYEMSSDEKKILITANITPIYRRSYQSDYYIYDIETKEISKVNTDEKVEVASLSPDSRYVSYIFKNNLYIKDLSTNEIKQITSDGKYNEIINGMPDWVYEEEFAMSRAYFWSGDSKKIAYIKFNESNVKEYTLEQYNNENYPEIIKYKYPKAGEDNSVVGVYVYDISSGVTTQADLGSDTDIYIPRIKWTSENDLLSIVRMNRLQNEFEVLLYNTSIDSTKLILTEESKTYIDENYNLSFLKDNNFLRLSQQNGFRHIFRYDINGKLIKQITKGNWEVSDISYIDEENQIIYYRSDETSPLDMALYHIGFDGENKTLISSPNGYTNANFSKGGKYFLSSYSDANTPPILSLNNAKDGKTIRVIEDNKKLNETMKEYGFVKKEFFKFKTEDGTELNGYMIKPSNIKEGEKLPVLMYVYGGPGSQQVLNAFSPFDLFWFQYLCQNGYIIACVDNRGTGGRGESFEKCTYLKLGEYELSDQIEAAKYLGKLSYVDKKRIGVWGWSYGGYMSSLCITKGADYFSLAIAVAPVTDWRYYDNIYTERYMRKPKDNEEGYKAYSPIYFTDSLKGKFLLVHGTEDDNVHTQNSYQLIDKLVKSNKQFEMQLYTNKNHNITGGNTRYHLFRRLSDFLFKNL